VVAQCVKGWRPHFPFPPPTSQPPTYPRHICINKQQQGLTCAWTPENLGHTYKSFLEQVQWGSKYIPGLSESARMRGPSVDDKGA
jgi:hypothetical protein